MCLLVSSDEQRDWKRQKVTFTDPIEISAQRYFRTILIYYIACYFSENLDFPLKVIRGQTLANINFQWLELENEAFRIFDQVAPVTHCPGLSSGTNFSPIGEGRIWLQ